ncbi:uncharacterized protein BDV17DRAFT_282561 [Aspergillus undulatus]|uniref:uncharacterized protein n=1 Tax=Aspergillus undulatus TaxID=1810928 RepID=UPI003CCD216F
MPNPTDLPPELFNVILTHALDDNDDIYRLFSLCLLSRSWYTALIARIYLKWTFNGAQQPFLTLWKFLITILRDPQLAAHVRTLKIGNWGFFPDASVPGPDIQLASDELDLTVLAHVPRSDPFLTALPVVGLYNLCELHLYQETPVDTHRPEDSDPDSDDVETGSREALRLEDIWPIFHLPKLLRLSLLNLVSAKAAVWLKGQGLSHIENLHLLHNWRSLCETIDVQALVLQPRALKSTALMFLDNPFDPRHNLTISNTELWACLQKHQATLETIDICRSKNTHRDENGHFGLLSSFSKLKHLHIQVEMLLGGCCGSPFASFRLKDTLPPTLETLMIYGEEGLGKIDISAQLHELISAKHLFPSLAAITLDDMTPPYILELHIQGEQQLIPAYRKLEQLCKDKGMVFRAEDATTAKGGLTQIHETCVSREPKKLRDRQKLMLRRSYDVGNEDQNDDCDDEVDPPGPTEPSIVHKVPFTDHTGKTAYMITDMAAFYNELMIHCEVKYDMYFLPGASANECVAHYQGENLARGSYKDQIKATYPGMVNRYPLLGPYRALLFISPDQNWQNRVGYGNGHASLIQVEFDHKNVSMEDARWRGAEGPLPPVLTLDIANQERNRYREPWERATRRGWTVW